MVPIYEDEAIIEYDPDSTHVTSDVEELMAIIRDLKPGESMLIRAALKPQVTNEYHCRRVKD